MATTCLALNASYEPLTVMSVKRAVRLVLQRKAEVIEAHPRETVKSASQVMPKPAVIRLVKFVKVPDRMKRSVTNTFLFARDDYRCQYCGRHERDLGSRESLTRDHLVPQSQGGPNTWENCVTACSRCNHKKADKTLQESGLTLRSTPRVPDTVWLRWSIRSLTPLQRKYVSMFYGKDALEALE
jgi:5-methylcytosine-specific restriction endonuclease McrA